MSAEPPQPYRLEAQIGFILRQATQRHVGIFAELIPGDLTPTQYSAINMLHRLGSCSQNQLGRLVAMDGATIKGVIDRLARRGITQTAPDPDDARLVIVGLTEAGKQLAERCIPQAIRISETTLAPLAPKERQVLLDLLQKII